MSNQPNNKTSATPLGAPEKGVVNFRVARPDGRVLFTVLAFVITALWFGVTAFISLAGLSQVDTFSVVVFVLVGGLLLWRAITSVRGYTIVWGDSPTDSSLVIRRVLPVFNIALDLQRLKLAYADPALPPILNTSIMSQGSLFGWSGAAQVTGYNRVEAYATSNKKAVVLEFGLQESAWRRRSEIEANGKRGPVYILSPNDPEGFAAELRRLPGVGGIEGRTAVTTRQARPATGAPAAPPAGSAPAATPVEPATPVNLTPSQRKAKRR